VERQKKKAAAAAAGKWWWFEPFRRDRWDTGERKEILRRV
jgi:hypothetical protein